ncbi:MAG: aminotransferase class V-fold PLP-dependent enzyme [Eubacteriales bacterium]|nr:aminotransferase class V-fold PLP-dependent enzyme [Eubacteriales bacterium]
MSEASLYQALKRQAAQKAARFHMPGHKGRPILPELNHPFIIDYTEIAGTGNLYAGDEPILSAERAAARYYGAHDCLFLTGGSTQALQTAIAAAVPAGGMLVVDRNCHKAAAHAMALLDLTPVFVVPEPLDETGLPGLLAPQAVERALQRTPQAAAVLVTSPNYYGVMQDIPALAAVCHAHGVPLLVDAAHGAHLKAAGRRSPIEEGADLAAVSTHKTLPALGQSALLLSSGRIPFDTLLETAPLFGTSSPSYVLLASIDLARAWLEGKGAQAYAACARRVAALRREIGRETVFSALQEGETTLDPCRLTICCRGTNVTGHRLSDILHTQFGVDAEMADHDHVVFICTGADTERDYSRLMGALRHEQFIRRAVEAKPLRPFPKPERVCSVRAAWFGKRKRVPLSQAAGEICARPVTPYPPGVPLLYPGEKIRQVHIEFLRDGWYTEHNPIDVMEQIPGKGGTMDDI